MTLGAEEEGLSSAARYFPTAQKHDGGSCGLLILSQMPPLLLGRQILIATAAMSQAPC